MPKRFFIIFLLLILRAMSPVGPTALLAGTTERDYGIKYTRNYTRKEYNNQSQNWSVIQDNRGIIYIANQGGVMEYDGVSWNEIRIPNKTARSLAMDDKGTIYVGGSNEIGVLGPGPKGTLQYVSLTRHLEKKYKNFSYVWRVHSTKEGIYFCTSKFLFLRNLKTIKVWEASPGVSFSPPFLCGGNLYTRQNGAGLLQMKNGAPEPVPGGEEFASKKIYIMAEFEPGKILIGTRTHGFYLFDGTKVVPFETDAAAVIKENYLTHGIRLSSGDFALATFRGGLFIMDRRGGIKHVFNKSSGLRDNTVWYVFEDSRGNLWLALNEGVTKIEYASPISIYDENHSNLPGKVLSVTGHGPDNTLYAGTTNGLYVLAEYGKFNPVPGIPGDCWCLLSTGDSLLTANSTGVFQVKNNTERRVINNHSYVLLPSLANPNRTWVGKARGLASLYRDNGNGLWYGEFQFENITREIRTIVEDKKGNLWLDTSTNEVLYVAFPPGGPIREAAVIPYNTAQGLPDKPVRVFMAAGHVMFTSEIGIFRFDEKNKAFIPDLTFGDELAGGEKGRGVFLIKEDNKNNAWLHSKSRNILAIQQPDQTFVLKKKPFLRVPLSQVNAIYPDPGRDSAWLASVDGLLRFDTKIKKNYDLPFNTLIRKVLVNGTPVFNGNNTGEEAEDHLPVIEYKDRNLRFEFAAPFFEDESATRYQCFLEGYDHQWTVWSHETWKDYTNIDPGLNTFRVRAKNVYGNTGREASFRFRVLSPWYKTWWAFALYAAALLLLMALVVRWRSVKLQKEKQALERVIEERTSEINRKKGQLEEQSEKLEEMDKVKSRFFANISHEFRTPLTLIMGPLEKMLSKCREKEPEKDLTLMLRNSQRLLGLINQLLELSKFDGGSVKLEASTQNLVTFLKGITASFEIPANQRELDLRFRSEEKDITLYIDIIKMEEVMCNLLANAVKFTPAGGRITVSVKKSSAKAEISVGDTGPGIPGEQLVHIFDRFYQSDSTYEHHRKGSGIGLAIAKELVELHGGEISVRSIEGEGTEFIIQLPVPGVPADYKRGVPADHKQKGRAFVPVLDVDVVEEEKEDTIPAGNVDGKNMVLVVEDSADMSAYIRGNLEPDYTVVHAVDGGEGIQKAREHIPDLIISDIMMPGVDGYELCRVLKSDRATSHIPIVLLTAKASEANILEGLETGADDYITKPFSARLLCARIRNLIDLRSHLQQTLDREMTLQPVKMDVSSIDKEFINDLRAVIEANISDPDFNVEELSKKLCMGRTTVYRKIGALSGESPTEFIRSYRLKQAAELLKKSNISVLEAAFEVGFSSATYFTKCFKKKFHQLPSTFRESESESKQRS